MVSSPNGSPSPGSDAATMEAAEAPATSRDESETTTYFDGKCAVSDGSLEAAPECGTNAQTAAEKQEEDERDCGGSEEMRMEARIGRERQRYSSSGARLIAGCIPIREVRTGSNSAPTDAGRANEDGTGKGNGVGLPGDVHPPPASSGALSKKVSDYEVLMITSRDSRDRESLIFPKGGWEEDETSVRAAIRETWEEAGVVGDIGWQVGSFHFQSKRAKSKGYADGACVCWMYVMNVQKIKDDWPEMKKRERRWLKYEDALAKCRHPWMRSALEQWQFQIADGDVNLNYDGPARQEFAGAAMSVIA